MQSLYLTPKQLIALGSLILFCLLLLIFSIHIHNDTFFVTEKKKQKNNATTQKIDIIPISSHDPILGSPAAPITVIGFEDFLCNTCRTQHTFMNQLLEQYPKKVKFIWKDLPITTIPASSEIAHTYGYCMHEQGAFVAYKNAVFNQILPTNITENALQKITNELDIHQQALQTCINSTRPTEHIEKNKLLAQALHIQRVPTFFVDGIQIQTPQSLSEWISILNLD